MKRFPQGDKNRSAAAQTTTADQASDLSALFNYPSLGRLFDRPDSPALQEMRERLKRTNQDLERVIRQGTREDAERAARVSRAYAAALALLDELAEMQQKPGA